MLFYTWFDKMKMIFTITLFLLVCSVFAQDKFYTKGLANGYAWTAPASASKVAYAKGESLSAILNYNKFKTDLQREVSFPLECKDDVDKLLQSNSTSTIELETIEKMIDKFYDNQENLVIPVLGAYCCCIKELTGESFKDIEKYRQELLEFSSEKSEK